MRKGKIALSILCLLVGFLSCNKDDGGGNNTGVELRDRAEQQNKDNDSIVKYLTTHYYNAGDFDGNTNAKSADLIIKKIPENGVLPNPTDKVLYSNDGNDDNDAVKTETLVFKETTYKVYFLDLNPSAGGESPKFSDQIRLNYEGFKLDNDIFDSAVTPVDFDLVGLIIPGWRKVMPYFSAAESFANESDGTVSYTNHGVGVMFLPSGLGYFNDRAGGIPSYTSIAFKFDLFQIAENDHDNDGIPSYLEDLPDENDATDGEYIVNFEDLTDPYDDDTDGDGLADYIDFDDDGDGVPTLNELEPKTYTVNTNLGEQEPVLGAKEFERSRLESAGVITIKTVTIKDDNNDGLDDYLDNNITIDYSE